MNPKLQQYLNKVGDLPTMPMVATAVVRAVEDPKTSADDLRKIIERDPSIVARILKVANSSLFSFSREIQSLSHAIALLGMRTVKNLVLSASIRQTFKRFGLMEKLIWEHSAMAAPVAVKLSEALRVGLGPEEAFTAGLLHDLGKIALANSHRDEYEKVVARAYNEGLSFAEAERAAFGFDHADLGAEVAAKWKLPAQLETIIRYHHDPASFSALEAEERRLTALVNLTSACLTKLGVGRQRPVTDIDLAQLPSWQQLAPEELEEGALLQVVEEQLKAAESLVA